MILLNVIIKAYCISLHILVFLELLSGAN